jgi:diguanylate cyclase (GGDEF)-like protein/PAS domain S-box-containing protein
MARSAAPAQPARVTPRLGGHGRSPFPRIVRRRPGLRGVVLAASALLVVGLSFAISANVADHLRASATDSAVGNIEAIVRGYVDPILTSGSLDLDADVEPDVAAQLERLVVAGDMRLVNIWTRDGRVMYSTDPTMRGARLGIDHELAEALLGETVAEFGTATDEQGASDRLPAQLLEIYSPIRGNADGPAIGVFEVYLDAQPIEERVDLTARDVFVIGLVAGAFLLGLLWLAFAGAARRLGIQNDRLGRLNDRLRSVSDDLRQREARFRSLVQNSSDAVAVLSADGAVTYESDAVARVLGHDPRERIGARFDAQVHPDDRARLATFVDGLLRLGPAPSGAHAVTLRLGHADGTWRWVEAIGQNLLADDAVGGLVLNYRDVTDRTRLEEQLRHEAFHDPLTGLANRALFSDRVAHALMRRRRPDDRAAVLFIDLDDFKVVNDSLGHAAGDLLLTAVAERLRACLRGQDTAARLGGDEFGVLLEDSGEQEASEVAARLLAALGQPFTLEARQVFAQASIGIAMQPLGFAPGSATTPDELLRNADAAMYTAKARGKARFEFFQAEMHVEAMRRLDLRSRLDAALADGAFILRYQPVVDLASGRTVGCEALVRWRQDDGSLLGPADFIPVAEDSGFIVPLGRWVLEQACRDGVTWQGTGRRGASIAVNVASRQLREPGFAATVAAVLAKTRLPAGRLVLEITESTLLHEGDETAQAIEDLKRQGVRIALDDFGTGYSSLSHLRRFPIDVLKIDRSFVQHVDGPERDERALVRSIIRMAQALRLETVAEGIERRAQHEQLHAMGADLGQGYLYARPIELAELMGLEVDRSRLVS